MEDKFAFISVIRGLTLVRLKRSVRLGWKSLWSHRLRSLLTVLGILIGVSSVVAVVAITEGLDRYIADRVLELGTKSFSVQKFPDIITSS